MSNYVNKRILEKVEEIINRKKKQKYIWKDSAYEDIKLLSIDERGQLGEELIFDVFEDSEEYSVKYDSSVTDAIKGYDIIINEKKIEIKTATITTGSGMFQHEHLEAQRDYHILLFIDIAPNEVFLTGVKKTDVMWSRKRNDDKSKKTLHRRPNGDYKCDFTIKHIKTDNIPKFRKYITGEIKSKKDIKKIIDDSLNL